MRRFKVSRKGALEGLPLYLIIMVIIAAIGIAILVGWMYMVRKPELGYIEIEVKDMVVGNTYDFNITAYDTNGKTLENVEISLWGCGVDTKQLTGKDGRAFFSVTPKLPENTHTGEIKVRAVYTGTTMKVVDGLITVHD
ncbi:MAG: hypothetical protein QXJ27_04665 [Thermoplasmata archaeon]